MIVAPITEAEWLQIADIFSSLWNIHNCLGVMDGKPIAIKCPKGGGSFYFNYKKFHSIVLMALVDADYKFIWIDVGANGCVSDAQIFNSSELYECIESCDIGLPADAPVPNDGRPTPFFIISDDVFLFAHGWWNRSWRWMNTSLTTGCPVHAEFPRMPLVSWRTIGDVCWNHKSRNQRL